ncbi:hypothetical protein RE474_06260 [Methanolobus sediminis]|uniref:TIGR04206 family protein n=1 Tax=Methanolobus sediminis TaxID=3072978 RepID=A0AA51UPX2_9EURY|nr:hypothetical protein [Methanolobus sediminis]WMW26311.1 hypothetical protein RE474_06260 [Methanolobus sediminis]
MRNLKIKPDDMKLLRKIMPFICLAIPWEVYFYSAYSQGWGIKFSVFYANFDIIYGTIFVGIIKQMKLLSMGGFLPSVRTLGWVIASFACIGLAAYELFKDNIEIDIDTKTAGYILILCGILSLISSLAVWNSSFKTLPIAPLFFWVFGYILLQAGRNDTVD